MINQIEIVCFQEKWSLLMFSWELTLKLKATCQEVRTLPCEEFQQAFASASSYFPFVNWNPPSHYQSQVEIVILPWPGYFNIFLVLESDLLVSAEKVETVVFTWTYLALSLQAASLTDAELLELSQAHDKYGSPDKSLTSKLNRHFKVLQPAD